MPNGKAVGIAQGIKDASDNFLRTFFAVKGMKREQKDEENQLTLQALQYQLGDENIPLRQKAKILDEIQRIAQGGKIKGNRLSDMMGGDELFEQEIETGETKTTKKVYNPNDALGIKPQPEDSSSIENPISREISQGMGGELPPEMSIREQTENVKRKRGDLSSLELKEINKRKSEGIDDERTIKRAERIARIQADIELKSAIEKDKQLGFDKPVFSGIAEEDYKTPEGTEISKGDFIVVSQNNQGDTRTTNLGKVKSEKLLKQSQSGLSASVRNLKAYWSNQIDPETGEIYTTEKAEEKALEDFKQGFSITAEGRKLSNQKTEQSVTGTTPPTPEQVNTNKEQEEKIVSDTLREYRKLNAAWNASGRVVAATQKEKEKADELRKAAATNLNKLLEKEYDSTDEDQVKEINAAKAEYNRLNDDFQRVNDKFNNAVKENEGAFVEMNSMAEDLQQSPNKDKFIIEKDSSNGAYFIKRNPNYKPNSTSSKVEFPVLESEDEEEDSTGLRPDNSQPRDLTDRLIATPQVQAIISAFKKANPNKKYSDRQWYKIAISKGHIKE